MLLTGQPLYQLDLEEPIDSPLKNSLYCKFIQDSQAELTRRNLYIESNALNLVKSMVSVDPSDRPTLE